MLWIGCVLVLVCCHLIVLRKMFHLFVLLSIDRFVAIPLLSLLFNKQNLLFDLSCAKLGSKCNADCIT